MSELYLKSGRATQRPYHLVNETGDVSLCGTVRRGDEGVTAVGCGPEPLVDGLICERCQTERALQAVRRVAQTSPFGRVVT